jgi:hypothetical protein
LKFFKPKELPVNSGKIMEEQKILKDFLSIINSDLSDKFKYVKSFDFEQQNFGDILEVMQKYFRQLLFMETGVGKIKSEDAFFADTPIFKKYTVQKIKDIINLIEDINNKFIFTNASPKLALEILLMEV